MTIDERITESKKSIKVPPFDFDKAFERIKKQKRKEKTPLQEKAFSYSFFLHGYYSSPFGNPDSDQPPR